MKTTYSALKMNLLCIFFQCIVDKKKYKLSLLLSLMFTLDEIGTFLLANFG